MLKKYLKRVLLYRNWKLKRIPDLEELFDNIVEYDPSFDEFRELFQEATAFHFFERYFISAMTIHAIKVQSFLKVLAGQIIQSSGIQFDHNSLFFEIGFKSSCTAYFNSLISLV